MTLRQLYYTSCATGRSGTTGFQIKAMSPGLLSDEQEALVKMLGYRIPPSLDVNAIASHPASLRYQYLNRNRCLIVCSQSNGPDESGRPGNFFAHCITTSPEDFSVFAPIMYWKHSFWKSNDPSLSLVVAEKASFDLDPSLEFESIWPFLSAGHRRDWFYRLLCAALHYDVDNRPIVILDNVDNVALWISCITFALPATYRHYVTFATYHHDPYQVPFMITGTTSDGRFHFSSDEYISYFVLNAEQNRISDVKESVYARFVMQFMFTEEYESKLIEFFEYCSDHLRPSPKNLAEQLNMITNLYLTVREKRLTHTDADVQLSLRFLLTYAESQEILSTDELRDVIYTAELYQSALSSKPSTETMEDYVHALRILTRFDPHFTNRRRSELDLIVDFVIAEHEALLNQLFPVLEELHSSVKLVELMSRPAFIDALVDRLPSSRWQSFHLTWKYLGPLFRESAANQKSLRSLLRATFLVLDQLSSEEFAIPPLNAGILIADLSAAARSVGKRQLLIESAASWGVSRSGSTFGWIYYDLVGKSPLNAREKYRAEIIKSNPSVSREKLVTIEINRDFGAAHPDRWVSLIEDWVQHNAGQSRLQSNIISQIVNLILPTADHVAKVHLSEMLLRSPIVYPHIEKSLEKVLVLAYFAIFEMKRLDDRSFAMVTKYIEYSELSVLQRTIMKGSLAMTSGKFATQSVSDIHYWLSKLNDEQYKVEAKKLINRFFDAEITLEGHIDMLQVTYVSQHQFEFWEIYWTSFKELFSSKVNVQKILSLFSFWFDKSLSVFSQQPYLGQSFFLQLPGVLEELRQEKRSREVFLRIASQSAKLPWYPAVQNYLVDTQKKRFLFFRW